MTADTVIVDPELARQALSDVLDDDAARAPAAVPPPRREPPPDATPDAPWGFKADGTPRKGPAGPGRPRKDAAMAARTEPEPAGAPGAAAVSVQARSYAEEVSDALTIGWMVLAMLPPTRPQAAVLHDGIPQMVPAWDKAAQHNTQIRNVILKISGEGSWAWVVPVVVSTMPVLMGMWQATTDRSIRPQLAAKSQEDLKQFVIEQARAAGMEIPEEEPPDPAPGSASSSPVAAAA